MDGKLGKNAIRAAIAHASERNPYDKSGQKTHLLLIKQLGITLFQFILGASIFGRRGRRRITLLSEFGVGGTWLLRIEKILQDGQRDDPDHTPIGLHR